MNRNPLYLVIGALIVIVVVLGGFLYHEESKPKGVQIQLDKNGLSVKKD
jgi:hypothetical protein